MKMVRFAQVIAKSGQPEPYTLWVPPEQDREFQSALKEHRVMTVHQETVGSKKDYGEVGFGDAPKGELLIFPKSLKSFEGQRVVGVKYDLLKSPPQGKPARSPAVVKQSRAKTHRKTPAPPNFHVFRPEETNEPAQGKRPDKASDDSHKPDASAALQRLTGEVRKAMKALQQGKAVTAYQRLEKALG